MNAGRPPRTGRDPVGSAVGLGLLVLAVFAEGGVSQDLPRPSDRTSTPDVVVGLGALGANGLLGGLAAGVVATLRGHDFEEAFLRGLAGGAVVFGGKWMAAKRFDGSGLLGRHLAATGTSVVRNAAEARPALSVARLPVGPLRVAVGNPGEAPRMTVNLGDVGLLAYAVADGDLKVDWGHTLSAGAPVFVSTGPGALGGSRGTLGVAAGTQVHLNGRAPVNRRTTLGHEMVHVIQTDFLTEAVSVPVERAVLGHLFPGSRVANRLQPGVAVFGLHFLAGLTGGGKGFLWDLQEAEADWLEAR